MSNNLEEVFDQQRIQQISSFLRNLANRLEYIINDIQSNTNVEYHTYDNGRYLQKIPVRYTHQFTIDFNKGAI